MNDSSGAFMQFAINLDFELNGTSELTLNGGNNPLNNSTINFGSTSSSLIFTNESINDAISEHLNKITVFGQPASVGSNILFTDIGGATLVQAVPEPGSIGVMTLWIVALLSRRRRK